MKKITRFGVLMMCMTALLSLFACRKQPAKPPDVQAPWITMELSRGDSYYPYNFNFSLTLDGGLYLATGRCADEDGNRYETQTGIEIPLKVIDIFDLDSLSDDSGSSFGDAFVLDAPSISLTLTYADGTQKKKAIGDSLSLEIYRTLLPYFAEHAPQE